jgi:hypothetical protein
MCKARVYIADTLTVSEPEFTELVATQLLQQTNVRYEVELRRRKGLGERMVCVLDGIS